MTAPSRHACKVLQKHFPGSRIRHILNGIDLKAYTNYADYNKLITYYPNFTKKSFLFVGRLGEEKSINILLEAFRLAQLKDPDMRLFIVGDGPERKEYERTVKRNNQTDAVFFLGRLPHKELINSGLIHHARAMITASITENQPITIIEAIACNTPIIIPDVDGINELLFDNGTSFPADNMVSCAEKMVELAENDHLYDHFTTESKKIHKEFDGMKIAENFETLYNGLINNTD